MTDPYSIRPPRSGDARRLGRASFDPDTIVRVAEAGAQPIGWCVATPLPGLPQERDLTGAVNSEWRRRGVGSALLKAILDAVHREGIQRVSAAVRPTDTATIAFLHHHAFARAGGEVTLSFNAWNALPPAAVSLTSVSPAAAAEQIHALYAASFHGLPWYQPYAGAAEIHEEWRPGDQLLVLHERAAPIGFVWVRRVRPGRVAFEPIGIVAGKQHQGHGRRLMVAALHHVHQRGARHVSVTVHVDNAAALNLYTTLDFTPTGEAYDFYARELIT